MIPRIFIGFPILILFLFAAIAVIVLFFKLFIKKPWIAAIVALVLLLVGAFFIAMPQRRFVSHRVIQPMGLVLPESREDISNTSAIWSPGIEDEFEADVYPSKVSAVRGLGPLVDKSVRDLVGDVNKPSKIILFQEASDRTLILELRNAIQRVMPEAACTIEAELRDLQPDEVGVTMWTVGTGSQVAPWARSDDTRVTTGIIEANVFIKGRDIIAKRRFVEKPWVEDFSGFLNNKPNDRFIIARSSESCLAESEANHQAMENACAQVAQMLERTSGRLSAVQANLLSQVNPNDIIEGGLVLDRFVQSFEGTAGKIWRQALLIDASAGKLTQLARRKADVVRAKKMTWARTFSSIAGLLVLITVVYVFLNAATKGYYAWSLRIAGVVLALILIFLLLV